MQYSAANAKLVADTLENRCISLSEALEELGMNPNLVNDPTFCCDLDQDILCCTDCAYWFLPSLITESPINGENICEECCDSY